MTLPAPSHEKNLIKRVGIIGTFDSKAHEFAFLRQLVISLGFSVYTIDIGAFPSTPPFAVDLRISQICNQRNLSGGLHAPTKLYNRITENINAHLARNLGRIVSKEKLVGIIGMGGARGSSVIARCMQTLPIGFPKVLVSTCAGIVGSTYIGRSDIVIVPSIVDIAGINAITRHVFTNAAMVLSGLAKEVRPHSSFKPRIAITMLGNTTKCCDLCRSLLEDQGFEAITFHANGIGGKCLEDQICQGTIDGVLDVTTTEIGNHAFGGLFDAGPERLRSAIKRKIPLIIAPGGLDFLVFKSIDANLKYKRRRRHQWNQEFVLVRTNQEENKQLAHIVAKELKRASGPFTVVIPTKGFSLLGECNNPFHSARNDNAFIHTISKELGSHRNIQLVNAGINSPEVAYSMVKAFFKLWTATKPLPTETTSSQVLNAESE